MRLRLRWLALALAALANLAAYYNYDAIAPVADLLRTQRGLSQTQIGLLNAVYSIPNIPLSLIGGLVIDRIGAARAAVIASAFCLAGAALTAIGDPYTLMLAGRLLFGIGSEALYIALLVGIARWFAGAGGALATALFFSVARIGSWLADTSPGWAGDLYRQGWQPPLLVAAALAALGLGCAVGFRLLDRLPAAPRAGAPATDEVFRLDRLRGLDRSFWHILWLNVLFASVFFPFRSTFSIQYFQDARGLTLAQAGMTNSWVFFAAILATPLFGLAADRWGRRASLLVLGAALMPLTFLLLATEACSLWITTALMGVSFSVIPAVIWPATAMLVEKQRLGTAFGLINLLQSLGLTVSNYAAGWLNDRFGASSAHPAGYAAMFAWFGCWSLVALACAVLLLARQSGRSGQGLELARPAVAA